MPLKELGARIQAARQAKGLTIEDVALKLKVHRTVLRAIEEGDLDELPEPVYARSFTRSYAAFVGVDQASIQEAVDLAFPLEQTPEYVEKTEVMKPFKRRKPARHGWIAVVLIVVVAAVAAWYYMTYVRPASTTTPAPAAVNAPSGNGVSGNGLSGNGQSANGQSGNGQAGTAAPATVPENPAPEAAAPETAAPEAANSATNSSVETARAEAQPVGEPERAQSPAPLAAGTLQTAPGGNSQPVAAGVNQANSGTAQENANSTQAAAPTAARDPSEAAILARAGAAAQGSTHSLVLTATEQAWFSIMVDGAQRQYTFQRGQSAEFTFTRQATLRMGNAGGVSIVYNGEQLPTPGARGQVRTMVFPPAS